ncbi:hypothetical protein ALC53_01754 [Atta colombica]|uniref:DNA-directed DNA polymerase n=1 Tax=Atta colombica TaxID=520822 RepID=A0A151I670_9HYME|nr:hypothetical protein ALC53_01754 [Atta colombica]
MLFGDYANSQDLESQTDLPKIPRIAEAAILGMEVFHARAEKLREEAEEIKLQQCDECIEQLEELCRAKRPRLASSDTDNPFLEDAENVALERVRDTVERHGNVKVNTAFNGEFAMKDKRANKSIVIKNSEIYRYTNLRVWCLHYFNSCEKLQLHEVDQKINDCAIRLPSEGDKWFEFDNYSNRELVPFIVYADLYQRHEAFSIGYYVRCAYDDILSYYFHRDEGCIIWFAQQLNDLAYRVKNIVSANVPMVTLSKQQWEAYCSATRYHICEKPFALDDTRVRDHCHLTDRYCGPAHSNCNVNYKNSFHIPIVFHNLSGYDAHFIIKEIATAYMTCFIYHVDSIKNKTEKNFQKNGIKLRFIYSFKFLVRNHVDVKLITKYTISESKIALSPYDKRYVVSDSTETLP